ncbi:MAG: hypothetical protein CME01_13430 [Geminicoccus sp.]|nr:hypothetical protein [Geminicoccus sp.]
MNRSLFAPDTHRHTVPGICSVVARRRARKRWQSIAACLVTFMAMIIDANVSKAEESTAASIALYSDAANFQNKGAIDLAIRNWEQFLKQYPKDDLASQAAHYRGVCEMKRETPDYGRAITAFQSALTDPASKLREQSLANLGWCQFVVATEGQNADAKALQQTIATYVQLIKEFPQTTFADRAYFYSGEAAYQLGHTDAAIASYQRMLSLATSKQSPLRCDTLYAYGVALEEAGKDAQAVRAYQQLLQEFSTHEFAVDVRLRLGDQFIAAGKQAEALKLFDGALSAAQYAEDERYAMLRKAFALVQSNRPAEAAQVYDLLRQKHPNSPEAAGALLAAGQAYYRAKQLDLAGQRFQQQLQQPNVGGETATESAHWLAQIYLNQKQTKQAAKVAEDQIKKQVAGTYSAHLYLDLVEALAADPVTLAKSLQVAKQAAQKYGDSEVAPRLLYNAAFSALQLDQYAEAVQLANQFMQRFKDDPLAIDVRFIAAESTLLQGKSQEAVQHFQALLDRSPANHASRGQWALRAATAANLSKQYDLTLQLLKKETASLKSAQQQSEAALLMGKAALLNKSADQAIGLLASAIKLAPSSQTAAKAQFLQATAYDDANRSQEATQAWTQIAKRTESTPEVRQARYRLAQLAADQNDHATALQWHQRLINDPASKRLRPYALFGFGWSLIQADRHGEAIAPLSELLDKSPNHETATDARLTRGIAYRVTGDSAAARRDLQAVMAKKPTGTQLGHVLYELALVDQAEKRFGDAANKLSQLLSKVPDYDSPERLRYEMGWALQQAGKTDQAAKVFEGILAKSSDAPFTADAAFFVGQFYYDQKNWDKASEFLKQASAAKDPVVAEKAMYRLAWSDFQAGNLQQARQAFSNLTKRFPKGELALDAYMMDGECLFRMDQFEQALQSFTMARKQIEANGDDSTTLRDPEDRRIRELVLLHGGQSAAQLQQWDVAIDWFDALKTRFRSTSYLPQLLYELGFVYQQKGDMERALSYFQQVAEGYRRQEVAARSRFMMGEIYFLRQAFDKAIPEFQSVMYGFGGSEASATIRPWQARSGFEAGRCAEALIQQAQTDANRTKAQTVARTFYQFVVDEHRDHELAKKAAERLEALK